MGSPSYPQSPGDQAGPAQPSTAEIPVVRPAAPPVTKQLPPHPGATAFGAHPAPAVEAAQPTGPVDFVPGPPGAGVPPPPPAGAPSQAAPPQTAPAPAAPMPTWPESLEEDDAVGKGARKRRIGLPEDRGALAAIALAALAVVLLQLGLGLELGSDAWWDEVPLWSAFATAATLVGLLAVVLSSWGPGRSRGDQAWRVGAAGLVGLSVFWLLVVLPVADGDRGFLLTAALGCLGAALWVRARND